MPPKISGDPRCGNLRVPKSKQIAEFPDGTRVERNFPNKQTGAPKWYHGTIRYLGPNEPLPYIFMVDYDDGDSEAECYEVLKLAKDGVDNTHYRFSGTRVSSVASHSVQPAAPAPPRAAAVKKRTRTAAEAPAGNTEVLSLGSFGYKFAADDAVRQAALRDAVEKHGKANVVSRLGFLMSVNQAYHDKLSSDLVYLMPPPTPTAPASAPAPAPARERSSSSSGPTPEGEYVVDFVAASAESEDGTLYLVIFRDYPGAAKWELAKNIAAKPVADYELRKAAVANPKSARGPAGAAPVYRADLEFYKMAATAKTALEDAKVGGLENEIEKHHTTTQRMKEFVFLQEGVFNFYTGDADRFEQSLAWANECGPGSVLGITNDFMPFTTSNIFNDAPKPYTGADGKTLVYTQVNLFNKAVSNLRAADPGLPETLTRRNYITDYRFNPGLDAPKRIISGMMQSDAHLQTRTAIGEAHKKIFDERLLVNSNIQTMPYNINGSCTCYLCGKAIDVGMSRYKTVGELDHILPWTLAYIMNVVDTSLNYSPTHGVCNNPKRKNLPVFSMSLQNTRYVKALRDSVPTLETYKALVGRDVNKHKNIGIGLRDRESARQALIRAGVDPNATSEDLRSMPVERVAGGNSSAAARAIPAIRAIPATRLTRVTQVSLRSRRGPRTPAPSRIASKLGRALGEMLDRPIATKRDVLRVSLLGDLVDFYAYLARASRQSGGAPGESRASAVSKAESDYFSGFGGKVSGPIVMNLPARRDFLLFRYQMMYEFSFATYYTTGEHAHYVAHGIPEDAPDYSNYILNRLDYCLDHFLNYQLVPMLY